jgi:hypothetical protein
MNNRKAISKQSIFVVLLVACGAKPTIQEQPNLQGYCGYLTNAEVEAALGHPLTETPIEINEEYLGGKGCSYFAGKDKNGIAFFGYVVIPDKATFEKSKPGSEKVSDIGDEAFRVNGPDAQQLWVRKGDHLVMVALGDEPNPEGSKTLAMLVLSRLR